MCDLYWQHGVDVARVRVVCEPPYNDLNILEVVYCDRSSTGIYSVQVSTIYITL